MKVCPTRSPSKQADLLPALCRFRPTKNPNYGWSLTWNWRREKEMGTKDRVTGVTLDLPDDRNKVFFYQKKNIFPHHHLRYSLSWKPKRACFSQEVCTEEGKWQKIRGGRLKVWLGKHKEKKKKKIEHLAQIVQKSINILVFSVIWISNRLFTTLATEMTTKI